jgi:hypothetical protein
MAKGFKHGAGGAGLNFNVVCNPQPANPRENTIWVDTDRINNYYFSAAQPDNMVEYDVWFPTGTSSATAFDALKKNSIQVYPLNAQQYIGGALVNKTAKTYQNGVWCDFNAFPQDGTWIGTDYVQSDEVVVGKVPTVTMNEGVVTLVAASVECVCHAYLSEKIDFSKQKSLSCEVNTVNCAARLRITDVLENRYTACAATNSSNSNHGEGNWETVTIDLSNVNISGYVLLGFYHPTGGILKARNFRLV